jgi:ABC-type cobalamin transport system permease subunit
METGTVDGVMRRKVIDWKAVLWAGLVAGTVFLLANLFAVPRIMGGSFWISVRLVGSMLLGEGVLAPPATFHAGALVAAIAVHYTLALVLAAVIAFVVHRGGLIGGVLGGAVLGAAFYFINYYTLSYFFPQFFALRHGSVLASHILFGALAGGIYELLEDQIYEVRVVKEHRA